MTQLLVDQRRDVTVIRPEAEVIDAHNARQFRRELVDRVPADARILLDLSGVQFIDSSGCGAILGCLRHLNAQGDGPGELKICVSAGPVRALFEMMRMHKLIEIYNNREDALRAFDAA